MRADLCSGCDRTDSDEEKIKKAVCLCQNLHTAFLF